MKHEIKYLGNNKWTCDKLWATGKKIDDECPICYILELEKKLKIIGDSIRHLYERKKITENNLREIIWKHKDTEALVKALVEYIKQETYPPNHKE